MFAIGDNNPRLHIRRPYVNYTLILLCLFGMALGPVAGQLALVPGELTGAAAVPVEWEGSHWSLRLISYQFLHGGWLHLLGNLIALWVFGDNVEDSMGHARYAIFYLLCGAVGGIAEAAFSSDPSLPVVGASGSIAGVMGAYLLMHPRARIMVLAGMRLPVLLPAGLFVGMWISADVLMMLFDDGTAGIAWWAHLGGFAAGLALLPLMRWRDVALFQPESSYPDVGFLGLQGKLIDLTPKVPLGATLSERMVATLKAVFFFFALSVLVYLFVP